MNLTGSTAVMWSASMYVYLPPANEVWGKVMFSEASVILSKGVSVRVCLSKGISVQGDLCPGGVSVQGDLCPGGLCRETAPESKKCSVRTPLECFLCCIKIHQIRTNFNKSFATHSELNIYQYQYEILILRHLSYYLQYT